MQRVMGLMSKLVHADKHAVADLMASYGHWKAGTSAVNNTYKKLMDLVNLKKLEKGDGFFSIPGRRSEYGEHARAVTKALVQILKAYPESVIYREHTITEVGLRPDALILLTRNNNAEGVVIWLEVCISEREEYFQMKVNALKSWDARPYLSRLFGYQIPAFHVVKDSQLSEYLEAPR